MNDILVLLLISFTLGIVSYFLVWTIHNASIFENLVAWAEASDRFIKRLIACPICLTYHVSLIVVGVLALVLKWDPGRWFMVWCVTCCISLVLYSRKAIEAFTDE